MDDALGLGKAISSKVAESAYDDALAPAARQTGALAEDTLKAMRLFTAPLQYLACWQDRLEQHLNTARAKVPADKQVEGKGEVVTPAILGLFQVQDNEHMRRLFINLLSMAIHADYQEQVHPAFSSILGRLSPDEAYLFDQINQKQVEVSGCFHPSKVESGIRKTLEDKCGTFVTDHAREYLLNHIEHMASESLLLYSSLVGTSCGSGDDQTIVSIKTTSFGRQFWRVCCGVPNECKQ